MSSPPNQSDLNLSQTSDQDQPSAAAAPTASDSSPLPPAPVITEISSATPSLLFPQTQPQPQLFPSAAAWKLDPEFAELSQSWQETPSQDASLNPALQNPGGDDSVQGKQIGVHAEGSGNQVEGEQGGDEYLEPQPDSTATTESKGLEVETVEDARNRNPSGGSNSQSTASSSQTGNQESSKGGGNDLTTPSSPQANLSPQPASNPTLFWDKKPRFPTGMSKLSSPQNEDSLDSQEQDQEVKDEEQQQVPPSRTTPNSELQPGPSNSNYRKTSGANDTSILMDSSIVEPSADRGGKGGENGYQEAIRKKLGESNKERQDTNQRIYLGSDDPGREEGAPEDYSQDFEPPENVEQDERVAQTPLPPRRRDRAGMASYSLEESREGRSRSPSPTRTVTMTVTMNLSGNEDEESQRMVPEAHPTPLLRRRQKTLESEEEEEEGMSSFASESEEEEEQERGDGIDRSLAYSVEAPSVDNRTSGSGNQNVSESQSQSLSFVDAPSRHSFSQSQAQVPNQPLSPSRSSTSSEAKMRGPSDAGNEEEEDQQEQPREAAELSSSSHRTEESRDLSRLRQDQDSGPQRTDIPVSLANSQDASTSASTAQENEQTFIHREDVSDLAPIFQPQWKNAASPIKNLLNKKTPLESMWPSPKSSINGDDVAKATLETQSKEQSRSLPKMMSEAPPTKSFAIPSANKGKGKMYVSEGARKAMEEAGTAEAERESQVRPTSSQGNVTPQAGPSGSSMEYPPKISIEGGSTQKAAPSLAVFDFSQMLTRTVPSTPARPMQIFTQGRTPSGMDELRSKLGRAAERESNSPVKKQVEPVYLRTFGDDEDRETKRTRLDVPISTSPPAPPPPPSSSFITRKAVRRPSPSFWTNRGTLSSRTGEEIQPHDSTQQSKPEDSSPTFGSQRRIDYVKEYGPFMNNVRLGGLGSDRLSDTASPSQAENGSGPLGTYLEVEEDQAVEEMESEVEWSEEEFDEENAEIEEEEEEAVDAQLGAQDSTAAAQNSVFDQSKFSDVSRSRGARSGRDAPTPNASRDAATSFTDGYASPTRPRKTPVGRGEESLARRAEAGRIRRERDAGIGSSEPRMEAVEARSNVQAQDQDENSQAALHSVLGDDSNPTPPHPGTQVLSSRIPISFSNGSFPSSSSTKESFLRRSAIGKSLKAEKEESPRKTLRRFSAASQVAEEIRAEQERDLILEQKEEEERQQRWRKRQEEREREEMLRIEAERRERNFRASWAAQNRADLEKNSQQAADEELANQRAPGPQTIQVHQSFISNSAALQSPANDPSSSHSPPYDQLRVPSGSSITPLPAARSDAQMLPSSESLLESPTRSNRVFAATPSQASKAFRSASNSNLRTSQQGERGGNPSVSASSSSPLNGSKRLLSGGIIPILPDSEIFPTAYMTDRFGSEKNQIWDSNSKTWVKAKSKVRREIPQEAFFQSDGDAPKENRGLRAISSVPGLAGEPILEVSHDGYEVQEAGRNPGGAVSQNVLNRLQHQDFGTDTSDSSSPFQDFSSFGTNVGLRSKGEESQATPIPPVSASSPPSYFNPARKVASSSSAVVSAPIPAVALSAPHSTPPAGNSSAPASLGRAQVGVPRSGSNLRNELRFSSRETTRDSAEGEAGVEVLPAADEVNRMESTPEKPQSMLQPGSHNSIDRLVTPSRPGTSISPSITPQPPRSILKSVPSSGLRPTAAHHQGSSPGGRSHNSLFGDSLPGRSISFADGRKTGRMLDDSLKEIEGAFAPQSDSFGESQGAQKRMQAFLDLAEMTLGENALPEMQHHLEARLGPPSISFTGAGSSTPPRKIGLSTSRNLANGRSPWNFSHIKHGQRNFDDGNAPDMTLLTDASFAVAHDQMLVLLTDVHPWVEEWEELEKIDLRRRKVGSLIRLKEFLPSVEDVQV